jgi:RNA polymerase sigma-70 factor, ECF subfamily
LLDPHDQLAVARGLRAGSREAWTRLYDAYSVDIWRYVARLLGPDAAVADVVQETLLEAARSAGRFDSSRGTLWNWLAGIAHHRVALHWRSASRRANLRKLAEAHATDLRALFDDQAPDAALEQRELAALVRGVLAELPSDYAGLLVAKYNDDRSLAELAADDDSTSDAIKSKLARARREFRAVFERLTNQPPTSQPRTGVHTL